MESVVKAIVATPATVSPGQIEFGCEHLAQFMMQSENVAEKLCNAYADLQNMLTKPSEAQTTKDPKDPKKGPTTTLLPTFLCLQCSTISSLEERDAHSETRQHRFALESRSGCLFCGLCKDLVYDPTLEQIRIQQNIPPGNGKKRKLGAIYPQGEEDKFILPNGNSLSCLAGSPRGMWNLGQTCYMTVILQSLIHNPIMRNFFLANRHDTSDCPIEDCVACALTVSFSDVLATEKLDGHAPIELLHKSWKHSDLLAGYKQQDAHEYFQYLLDQLHSSTGCAATVSPKSCTCLYHQTFYGKLRSTVTCLACNNITVSEDPIIDLSLDLRHQIKRRKLDAKTNNPEAPLDLTTCLRNFTTPEKLGPDSYNCESQKCQNKPQRTRKHLTIKKLPPTMCIQLKRYEHNKSTHHKIDTKLNFPLQLDMSPYTTRTHRQNKDRLAVPEPSSPMPNSPLTPRSPGWYDLSSVVVHMGKMDAGHYICYCRRDGQWFKFDDSKVTVASEKTVLDADAYLLFYLIRSLSGVEKEKGKTTDAVKDGEKTGEKNGGINEHSKDDKSADTDEKDKKNNDEPKDKRDAQEDEENKG